MMSIIVVLSTEETREDVLLGVIVHSKVLGRSRHHHHHHHHRHKRPHPPHHHLSEKRSKLEVGIGNVTPPESPKKPSTTPPVVTSSVMTSSTVTPIVTSIPSVYGTGENEVTSTSITHFSAGIKDDDANNDATDSDVINSEVAYSPSDDVAKPITIPTTNPDTPVPVTNTEFTAPSLSPNTMSRLQSLIQTVKDSIASLPSPSSSGTTAAVTQEDTSQSTVQTLSTEENNKDPVTTGDNTAPSAYVFHESLPVTTSVAMVTNLQPQVSSTRQHPSFYGNQDMYQNAPQMYGDKRFEAQLDNHHGYQGQREQWIPYRSNWSPQRR